jgi:rubrerythrin
MYCPKCGKALTEIKGVLTCVDGGMGLSQNLHQNFIECYEKKLRIPKSFQRKFRVGGNWFCPACGVACVEDGGSVNCPKCKLSLD